MRERLIELISDVQYMGGLEAKLADHLLANGVIVPPCKVGDWVYIIRNGEVHRNHVCQIHISKAYEQTFFSCYGEFFGIEEVGKTVFLSREEAEKALEERSGNE